MSKARLKHRDLLKPKLIALSVAGCFSLSTNYTAANPTGGTVASGSAGFATSGNTLTITNSANAIINWQSFSIAPNEITRFIQSSGASAVLNRVTGANGAIPKSQIDGLLQSVLTNGAVGGRVFLLNSSGIVIGKNATIDVGGFVASSLNLSDQDFLAGKMRFTETPGAGKVSNAGTIDTTSAGPGGRVFLIAPDVENSGIIRTPQGQILLAAGKSVDLVAENNPSITVTITADSEQALNVGQLIADSGRVGMFGALVRQGGVAQANSAVVGANGEIRLVATKDLTLDAGSSTTANGPSGGNITLQAQGGTNLIYGNVEAKGDAGQGGTVQALGVRVGVLGHGVIDASGDAGGGTVLVGGDAHGANPNVQNAQQTLIGPDGVIRADAATTGDGGRVIVWSDAGTQVYGQLSVRGGALGGNGGLAETSSAGDIDLTGVRIDARAPRGTGGTWLIDPLDVTIIYGANLAPGTDPAVGIVANNGVDNFAAVPVNGGQITSGTLETNFLNVGTTRIQATRDVLFKSNLNLTYATVTPVQTFEVRAVNNINMAADGIAHTISTNGQHVVLSANDIGPNSATPLLNPVGTGSIVGGGAITTNGGNVVLSGYGINVGAISTSPINPIIVGAGYVSMTSYAGDITTGSITTHAVSPPTAQVSPGGDVTLSTTYGNIVVNGTIDTRGADGVNSRSSNQGTNGGAVALIRQDQASAGAITVTGDILTSGGAGAAGVAGAYAGGGAGGSVFIYAGAPNLTPLALYGTVVVNGNVNTRGGYGAYGVSGYGGGSGGAGGAVLVYADAGHAVTVGTAAGGIDASGGAGGAGASAYAANPGGVAGFGANGGTITLYGAAIKAYGTITSNGGAGGNGADGGSVYAYAVSINFGDGGVGGAGGAIGLYGSSITTGAIIATGGVGGTGGSYIDATVYSVNASATGIVGNGGRGGGGGSVALTSTGDISTGATIDFSAGAGGNAGNGNKMQVLSTDAQGLNVFAQASLGQGGSGGFAGSVTMNSGGNVSVSAIRANGGAGGTGSSGGSATATATSTSLAASAFADAGKGGLGNGGGGVTINGTGSGYVSIGSITATGGAGGAAGNSSAFAYATTASVSAGVTAQSTIGTGSAGFQGGSVYISTLGDIRIPGGINLSGGATGAPNAGGTAVAYGSSPSVAGSASVFLGDGAEGGSGGGLTLSGANITTGAILLAGNKGGDGVGAASASATGNGPVTTGVFFGNGGSSGFSSSWSVTGTGAVQINGAIDATRSSGGNGASASGSNGYGGSGGSANSSTGGITISGASVFVGGPIIVRGGDGGNGGLTTASGGTGGSGGRGGNGGSVDLTATTSVTVSGSIDVAGGKGGSGGDAPLGTGGSGGSGGVGGTVSIDPLTITIGAISAGGGAGGAGGYGGTTGGIGGAGGVGGNVAVNNDFYGDVAIGNIDVSGGAGGAGGGSGAVGIPGGAGGAGGTGGIIGVLGGSLDLATATGGTLSATGGNGGAGGSGTAGYGGAGGIGGSGGLVDMLIQTSTGTPGTITVVNSFAPLVAGGTGGAGGAGGGASGASGTAGSAILVYGDILGFLDTGSTNFVFATNTVTNQTNKLTGINTAPSSDETEKKADDKNKKQVAACK